VFTIHDSIIPTFIRERESTIRMATTAAPLSAEPALQQDLETLPLPPKSYADAAVEEPPANGANDTNGVGDGEKATTHTASVLKIVGAGAPAEEEEREGRPRIDRKESKREYSAIVWHSPSVLC
jgi:2-acylglycerol O-acyltransferase 2